MKQSIHKIILCSALLAITATSCNNEETTVSPAGDRVAATFSAGTAGTASTRATDNNWNVNDHIGITMLDAADGHVVTPYNNYNYTTPDGSIHFSPATEENIMYFPVDGSEVTFRSYYPYSSKLPADMLYPVSVADQSSLSDLDLMTAEHIAGTSKDDPNVRLHFYHRLAKVLFDLTFEDEALSLEGATFKVKGLKTTGSYNILKEELNIDNESGADISIPIHKSGNAYAGTSIFLPREAGAGVTFEVTLANGGIYTATLKDDVPFLAGHKHILHINLRKTPVTVSATIEEWLEGPENTTDVIRVVTGLEDSKGFSEGDTLRLFMKDQADYDFAAKFTYNADGKWTTTTPIYWENITADPAHFIGTTVIDGKLNNTQMDDILVSAATATNQYTGVNLEMAHAGAKAIVQLKSSNNTFSADELKGATVVFPGYRYTGTVNEKGEFVTSDATKDITAENGVAIFPPQTIKKGDVIAVVTVKGREYEIKADDSNFDFKKGVATKLILDLSKAEVEMSATVTPWTEESHEFTDVRIGSAHLTANGGNLLNGDVLNIYTGTDANRTQQPGHFTYNTATKSWSYSGSTPLYWENMPSDGNIYASITRPAISGATGNNQLPDYITATPITNNGGTDNTALNFAMTHKVAKVVVILRSGDYNLSNLKSSTVVLPGYKTGATMNNGVFVPGTTTADIKLPNLSIDNVNSYVTDAAYLQPQTIGSGATKVKVTFNGRVYEAKTDKNGGSTIEYEAGKVTTLIVDIKKTGLQISTTVSGWTDKPAVEYTGMMFSYNTENVGGFKNGDQIDFYKVGSNGTVNGCKAGTVSGSSMSFADGRWYRDDFSTTDKILAIYPGSATSITTGTNGSFSYTCKNGEDLQTAVGGINNDDADLSLGFTHALSKVTVNVCAGDGFGKDELAGLLSTSGNGVALNNFKLTGNISTTTGKVTGTTGNATPSFAPGKLATPNTVNGKAVAASYETFIMPQTITASDGSKTTIVTVTLNGKSYEAKITANKTFAEGEHYVYNITLSKTGISFSATVAPWTDGTGGDITIQ